MTIRSLLAVMILCAFPSVAYSQKMPTVRVVSDDAVVRTSRVVGSDVVAEPAEGDELDVLDVESGWVWVLLPADRDGTRRPGWIRSSQVELVSPGAAGYSMFGVAAALEEERAAAEAKLAKERAEAEARLAEARRAVEQAREEYERAKAGSPDRSNKP